MALKNTYTSISADKSTEMIKKLLLGFGVREIMFEYSDDGQPFELRFYMNYLGQKVPVKLPARVDNVYKILNSQTKRGNLDIAIAYRVAWKNIHDWVYAQITLIRIEQAELFEVFLPYIAMKDGKTLFESKKEEILGLPSMKE